MKKAISYLKSLMNFSGHSGGAKEPSSTSKQSRVDSNSEKFGKDLSKKLLELLDENERLKEEIRLRDLQEDRIDDL